MKLIKIAIPKPIVKPIIPPNKKPIANKIPAKIAKGLPEHLVESPKAKSTTIQEISEGE